MSVLTELKRRHVVRVLLAYAIAGWVVVEVSDVMFPGLGIPSRVVGIVTWAYVLGFVPVAILAWIFEWTPEGLKRDLGLAGPAPDKNSIAVLPFVNMSDDASNEYFSDGLSEELLNLLAKIPELHVAARTSSFSFKGEKVHIPSVAGKLNVANVLEGSVRKSGDRVRITVQLIEATSGYHLWSETYDRTLDDIFAIQDEIARSVVDALKISLLGEVPTVTETDPQTFALYLQGMYFTTSGEPDKFDKAIGAFTEALERDPNYAPAWSGLAHAYWYQISYGVTDKEERIQKAFDASERALTLDENVAEIYAVDALLSLSFDREWSRAEAAIRRGLEIAPGNAKVIIQAGNLAKTQGRFEDAEEYLRRAIALDPLNTTGHIWLALVLCAQDRLDEAEELLLQVLALNPKRAVAHQILGRILLMRGDPEAALEEMRKEPAEFWKNYGMNLALFAAGRQDEADSMLQDLIAHVDDNMAFFQIAESMAVRGRADEAFDWLERAYEQRDNGITQTITSTELRSLHDDPRWPLFLQRIGLKQL
jgi:adenylate cyclase